MTEFRPGLSLRRRFYLIVAGMLSVPLCLGFVTFYYMDRAHSKQIELVVAHRLDANIQRQATTSWQSQVRAWKNILLRGHETGAYHRHLSQFYDREREFRQLVEELGGLPEVGPTANALIADLKTAHSLLGRDFRNAIRLFNSGEGEVQVMADRMLGDTVIKIDEWLVRIHEVIEREHLAAIQEIDETLVRTTATASIVALVLLVAGGAGILWIFIIRIASPLEFAQLAFERISSGDLRTEIVARQGDEVGRLLSSLEAMRKSLLRTNEECRQEVGERRRAEEEARRSEEKLRQILEQSPVGVSIITRGPFKRLFTNQSCLDMFGASTEAELDGIPVERTYADKTDMEKIDRQLDETGFIDGAVVKRLRLDGTIWWGLMYSKSVAFEGREAILVWHYDITERKLAEDYLAHQAETLEEAIADRTRELKESENLLVSLFENAPVALIIKDAGHRIERANRTYEQWYGFESKAMAGHRSDEFEDFQPPDDLVVMNEHEDEVLTRGVIRTRQVEREFLDGHVHTVQITKFPIYDADGKISKIGSVSVDLTETLEAEQANRRLAAAIDALQDCIAIYDADDRLVTWNEAYRQRHALNLGDGLKPGLEFEDIVRASAYSGDAADAVGREEEYIVERMKSHRDPGRLMESNRRGRWYLYRESPTPDGGIILVITDITDRKKSEQEIADRQRQLSALIDNVPGLVFSAEEGNEGLEKLLFVSEGAREILGYAPADLIDLLNSQGSKAIVHPDDLQRLNEETKNALHLGQPLETTFRMITKTGESRWVSEWSRSFKIDEDTWLNEGLVIDVTDQKEAERKIAESERQLSTLVDNLPGMIFRLREREGDELEVLYVSDEVQRIFGYTPEEVRKIMSKGGRELYHPDDYGRLRQGYRDARLSGQPYEGTHRARTKSGEIRWVYESHRTVQRTDDSVIIEGLLIDVTEQKVIDDALRESEARFRSLFENAPVGIAIKDIDGRYTTVNGTILDWMGWRLEDVVGKRVEDLYGEEISALADLDDHEVIENRRLSIREVTLPGADGRILTTTNLRAPMLTPDGEVVGICSFHIDVTESKALEAQLQQAQKMEAVGRLAGGIAHDFNNLLGAMMGFNAFLMQDLDTASPQHNYASRIDQAGRRAKQLVAQILTFSRMGPAERKGFDLVAVVDEALNLLRGSLPASTQIVTNFGVDRAPILGNSGQLSQVLMNLGVNANDAFDGGDGQITISIERVSGDDPVLDALRSTSSGGQKDRVEVTDVKPRGQQLLVGTLGGTSDCLRISVADNGSGIPPDVLVSMFDPFFTTKEMRKGTGLGLSVVRTIVSSHDGAMRIQTSEGEGTTFEIYLPSADRSIELGRDDGVSALPKGHGLILVIDDENDVADMLSIGLERMGYEVAVGRDGKEGLEIFGEAEAGWRGAIVDQVMPEARGIEVIGAIKKRRPDMPCILCTGYSDTLTEEKALARGADAFFLKPVTAETLGRRMGDLLGD